MKTLKEIYLEQNSAGRTTDKNTGYRRHLDLYEQLLVPYRETAKKVFEIGIRGGGSLNLWAAYFTQAEVYGLDNQQQSVDLVEPPSKGFLVDQSSKSQLVTFGAQHGPFDIGIDDGSHVWSHQILSFQALWPFISPGGLYVIEDTLTSYPQWLKHSKAYARGIKFDTGGVSAMKYFKDLVDDINFHGYQHHKPNVYQATIDWIGFRHNAIFLRKVNG